MNSVKLAGYPRMIVVALVVAVLSVFIMPLPSYASVQTAWEVPDWSDNVQVGPDNMPRVNDCTYYRETRAYNENGFERFSISGNSSESIDIGCGNYFASSSLRTSDLISESGEMVVAYDTDADNRLDTIRAYSESGVLLVDYPVLDECNNPAVLGNTPLISNGNIVFSHSSCVSSAYSIKAIYMDDESVVYDTPGILGWGGSGTSLTWFDQGVALWSYYGVEFITDEGIFDPTKSVIPVNGYPLAVDVDGTVAYFAHDEQDYDVCKLVFDGYDKPNTQKIVDCDDEPSAPLSFLPDGDFAYMTDYGSDATDVEVTIFHTASTAPNTVISVSKPIQANDNSFGAGHFFVDANGKIVIFFRYQENAYVGDEYVGAYYRTAFEVFSSTGQSETKWSSGAYPRDMVLDYYVAVSLANGGVYMIDRDNNSLIRVRVPGVSIGYIESVKWGVQPDSNTGSQYVALGDSYSAGTGSFNSDIDLACLRSTDNYAYYVKENSTRGIQTPDVVACNGAVTADLMPSSGDVSQSDVLGGSTEFVTLTIGGNDAGFADIIRKCVSTIINIGYGCSTNSTVVSETSDRMAALAGTSPSTQYPPESTKEIHSIEDVLRRIITKAPNAEVYIAGYPYLFGKTTATFDAHLGSPSGYTCDVDKATPLTAQIDYYDAQWMNDQADILNSIVSDAVDVLKMEGKNVYYVSPSTFDGHGLCDTQNQWLNEVVLDTDAFPPRPEPESVHPTVQGYSSGYGAAFLGEID
jgi:lysophospholipase L1-like esterase